MKTSHIALAILGLAVLANGDRIFANLEDVSDQQAAKQEDGSDRKELRQQAKAAQKLSAIALDRVQAGCIPVVEPATGKAHYFNEGEPIIDDATEQPIQEGFICNSLGLTAEVVDGLITDLVLVSPEDKAEYIGYFVMQGGKY